MSKEQEVDIFGISPDNVDIEETTDSDSVPFISIENIESFMSLSTEEQKKALFTLEQKQKESYERKIRQLANKDVFSVAGNNLIPKGGCINEN